MPVNLRKLPMNAQFLSSLVLWAKSAREYRKVPMKSFKKWLPWTTKSAREKVQKIASERNCWPVNFLQEVPVNPKKCPWKSSKNDVHGNFWGSCYKTVCIIFLYCIVLQAYVHTIDIHTYNTLFWIILFCIYYIQIVLYSILYCIYIKKYCIHTYCILLHCIHTVLILYIHIVFYSIFTPIHVLHFIVLCAYIFCLIVYLHTMQYKKYKNPYITTI